MDTFLSRPLSNTIASKARNSDVIPPACATDSSDSFRRCDLRAATRSARAAFRSWIALALEDVRGEPAGESRGEPLKDEPTAGDAAKCVAMGDPSVVAGGPRRVNPPLGDPLGWGESMATVVTRATPRVSLALNRSLVSFRVS